MDIVENVAKSLGGPVGALATGAGVLLLAPTVLPIVGRVVRPMATAALQSGIIGYRWLGEATSELVAEARAELEADGRSKGHQP